MNKKIMLLALAAVSAVVLALPAMASALEPLHLNPTPSGAQTIDDTGATNPTLSTAGGTTVTCREFHGSATFNAGGTTGTMNLAFGPECKAEELISCTTAGQAAGNIVTTALPFDLVTLANSKPGVLVTPNNNHFATFTCFGINTVVSGNGVIGTIEFPACGAIANEADIDFNATAHGVQEHVKVAGTSTEYRLKKGAENAAQDATGTLTLNTNSKLECT